MDWGWTRLLYFSRFYEHNLICICSFCGFDYRDTSTKAGKEIEPTASHFLGMLASLLRPGKRTIYDSLYFRFFFNQFKQYDAIDDYDYSFEEQIQTAAEQAYKLRHNQMACKKL
jgi:hypothetical protein